MKSITDVIRPSRIIDRVENGSTSRGVSLTAKQCAELWGWLEEIEDELIELRSQLGLGGMDRTDAERWDADA